MWCRSCQAVTWAEVIPSDSAFPLAAHVSRRTPRSLTLRALIWSCESNGVREVLAKSFSDAFKHRLPVIFYG